MTTGKILKHLSSIANDVVQRCALTVGVSVEELVEEFESFVWKNNGDDDEDVHGSYGEGYSRRLVEYCSGKAVKEFCQKVDQTIADGSFARFTFDLMLAWELPSSAHEEARTENVGKEREDKKMPPKATLEQDDISLFYSDIMPLLVDNEPSVGEDAFVWFGSLVVLVTDVVNGGFTFEALTASTRNRLHFPAYDKFLKEIDKCMKHLQKQETPSGVELGDDEFILHVEGTASSNRVIRHIGGTSWPGRLTLTNYALYFEASGVITYEDALKIDFSKDIEQSVKPIATGPWGAPLFDKAIVYESSELSEGIVIEFPEITSSTRRDHWLALTREILLLHQFLSTFDVKCPIQAWEMHARTILSTVRLHAAREMLRISPPEPTKFLIFALFDKIPKGDYVLEKIAESLKTVSSGHSCSASSLLRRMNVREAIISSLEEEITKESLRGPLDNITSLETAINKAREEENESAVAKATTEGLKEEGIAESTLVLMELLKPVKNLLPWFQEILMWERPVATLNVMASALMIAYKEWIGKGIAVFLFWVVGYMVQARRNRLGERCNEIVVCKASDKSVRESVVSAQYGLLSVYELVQEANIALLKIQSIFLSKAPKHADMVMVALIGLGVIAAVIPTKYFIMGMILYCFIMTSKIGQRFGNNQGNRRLKEWWDSIPVIPVRVVNEMPDSEPSTST
ncbi:uncharacterized protein LOC133824653 [Humulus lupulus]|uniref:uncharacterized protein LOC133824653 n=1 Tax=Humulus lupulus TaxID=3486 RepID=UPI002B41304A|nr:uncharacterized protein LOC133824653 [Humulus lupulus]